MNAFGSVKRSIWRVPDEPKSTFAEPMTDATMSVGEVKSRAASGAVLQMGRGLAVQSLGFIGSLVLARLLVPEDFGLVALGLTIVNVGQTLARAGLGAALIAREKAPERGELRAVLGLQLMVTSAIGGLAASLAIAIGEDALVTALMMLTLPLWAFKTPALIQFQRRLEFLAQVKVEIVETATYLVVAIALAALGLGAWSLAIATVTKALFGTATAIMLTPEGLLAPSFRTAPLRPILSFGWRFQANGISQLVTGTALTVGIGAVGGLAALGLWTFAGRMVAIPQLLSQSIWRVGFPAFSRLMQTDANRDLAPLLERTVGALAVASSAIMCPLAASSPALVPLLFGEPWSDVSLILPGGALALTIAGPVGIVASSYLYAKGDANTALIASTVTGVTRLAVTLALLPVIGIAGIGVGWVLGAVSSTPFTVRRARRICGARLGSRLLAPALGVIVGVTAGWTVAEALGATPESVLLSALSASLLWLGFMLVLGRATLMEGMAMGRKILGTAFRGTRLRRRGAPVFAPSSGS